MFIKPWKLKYTHFSGDEEDKARRCLAKKISSAHSVQIFDDISDIAKLFLTKYDIPVPKEELEKILQKMNMSNFHALFLHPDADLDEITHVYDKLCNDLALKYETAEEPFLILLANNEVIKKYQKELERRGIDFWKDWEKPESRYRQLLKLAEENDHFYEMINRCSGWDYIELEK